MNKRTFIFLVFFILAVPSVYGEVTVIWTELLGGQPSDDVWISNILEGPPYVSSYEATFPAMDPAHDFTIEVSGEWDDSENDPIFINGNLVGNLQNPHLPHNSPNSQGGRFDLPSGLVVAGDNTITITHVGEREYIILTHLNIMEIYEATEYRWTAEGDDTKWHNPDNWDQGEEPPVDADTIFDLPGGYYFVTDYDHWVKSMSILSGTYSFETGTKLTLASTDSNSLWVNGGDLEWEDGVFASRKAVIGGDAPGAMFIEGGGWDTFGESITIGKNAKGVLSISNRVVVTAGNIDVGYEAEGNLTIQSGGSLIGNNAQFGFLPGSRAKALVNGSGSDMFLTDLHLGPEGYGALIVESGGYVKIGVLTLGGGSGFGVLLIRSFGEVEVTNQIDILSNGILTVESGGQVKGVEINVYPDGSLLGNGGAVVYFDLNNRGGNVSPGLSSGTLTVEGNYVQESGVLEVEIGGKTPDTEHDVLNVTGNITLGGTLKLFFADGFAPKTGDSFEFIQTGGTATGTFAETTLAGLQDGFQYEVSSQGGSTKLTAQSDGLPACIDEDGDGYPRYAISACPNSNDADCDDNNPDVHPGAAEIPDNLIDDDCDGEIDDGLNTQTTTTTTGEQPPCATERIYGQNAHETELLRQFRDNILSKTQAGQELIRLYYRCSPLIVNAMEADEDFKQEIKDMMDEVIPMLSH